MVFYVLAEASRNGVIPFTPGALATYQTAGLKYPYEGYEAIGATDSTKDNIARMIAKVATHSRVKNVPTSVQVTREALKAFLMPDEFQEWLSDSPSQDLLFRGLTRFEQGGRPTGFPGSPRQRIWNRIANPYSHGERGTGKGVIISELAHLFAERFDYLASHEVPYFQSPPEKRFVDFCNQFGMAAVGYGNSGERGYQKLLEIRDAFKRAGDPGNDRDPIGFYEKWSVPSFYNVPALWCKVDVVAEPPATFLSQWHPEKLTEIQQEIWLRISGEKPHEWPHGDWDWRVNLCVMGTKKPRPQMPSSMQSQLQGLGN